jgi:hypothetical protein
VNHGDAAPLTTDSIVPASFLLRGAQSHQKKNLLPLLRHYMPQRRCPVSPPPIRRLSPGLRHPPLLFAASRYLHRLCNQACVVVQLIAALDPDHRENTLASRPNMVIDAALHDCLGLNELILGEFVLADIPPLQYSPF